MERLESRLTLSANVLDTTFGDQGKVLTNVGQASEDTATSMAVLQDDGKIVVAGTSYRDRGSDFAVARYDPDGSLDTSFGDNGIKFINFYASDTAYDLALDTQGRIVVVGYTYSGYSSGDFAVARLDSNGQMDLTFDGDGRKLIDFGGRSSDSARGVTIDSLGRIIVIGNRQDRYTTQDDLAVARLEEDGSLDPSFDGDGLKIIDFYNSRNFGDDVAVDSQNRIIIVGFRPNMAVVRLNASDGSLDTTFDGDGRAVISFPNMVQFGFGVAIDAEDRPVITGYVAPASSTGGGNDFVVARLTEQGSLDPTFSSDGWTTVDFGNTNDFGRKVTIDSVGRIVVAGRSECGGLEGTNFAVARLLATGALDETFGVIGRVTVDFSGGSDIAWGVAVDTEDRVLLVGQSYQGPDSQNDFALARLTADGILDTDFGGDGRVITEIGAPTYDRAYDVIALQPDGRIVVVGTTTRRDTREDFVVLCYNSDGSLDTSFGSDGSVHIDFGDFFDSTIDEAFGVVVDANGRIIVVGQGHNDLGLARLYPDGSFDPSFGTGGRKILDLGGATDIGRNVAMDSLGRLVISGYYWQYGTTTGPDFFVARLDEEGDLDASFGNNGWSSLDISASQDYGFGMAIDSQNRIIVSGYASYTVSGDYEADFVIARWNEDGTIDDTFGENGRQLLDFNSAYDFGSRVAVDSLDRPVMIGHTDVGDWPYDSANDVIVARLTTAGSLDPSFSADGWTTIDFGSPADVGSDIAVDKSGRILAAGYTWLPETGHDFAISSLNDDGSFDLSFGDDGIATVDFGNTDDCGSSVTVDALGRSVVAGWSYASSLTYEDVALVRLMPRANSAPSSHAGGPYNVTEGGSVTLDASGSSDPDQDDSTLTYEWDFDGDNDFNDATGIHPTFDASALDGPSSVTIALRVTDNHGEASTESSVISVLNVAPSVAIVNAPAESPEGNTITLSSSVTDPATQDTFTYAWSVTKDGHPYGAVTLSDSPTLAFTPDDNALFEVTLVVTDDDGEAGTDTKSIHVTNVAPVVTLSGPLSAEEGQTKSYSFTTSDPGDDTFSWVSQSCGAYGILSNAAFDSVTGSGSFDCTFSDGPGSSDVNVQVADSDGTNSNVDTVTVAVIHVNNAPIAKDDVYGTDEDITLTISSPGLLANDTDMEGDPIETQLVTGPSNGVLSLNADGSFSYTPNTGFSGVDTFTYQVKESTAPVWNSVGLPGLHVRSLAISPNWPADPTLLVGTTNYPAGFYRTTDGGENWVARIPQDSSSNMDFTAIGLSPDYSYGGTDQTVFLGGTNQAWVFRSLNSGDSWSRSYSGVSTGDRNTWDFAVSPDYSSDRTVFVVGNNKIHRSIDGGDTWQQIGDSLPGGSHMAVEISPNFAADQTIFDGTLNYGVFKSIDGGSNWTEANFGLPKSPAYVGPGIRSLLISPDYENDQTLFAGVDGVGTFRSTDGGNSWTQFSVAVTGFSPDYANDQTMFGAAATGVLISKDEGNTWSLLPNTGLSAAATPPGSVRVSPEFSVDRTIFTGTRDGVWKMVVDREPLQSNVATVTITVTAQNDSPSVATENIFVTVDEGEAATNTGVFSDQDDNDVVTISASVGTITQAGTQNGTWSWSFETSDGPDETQAVTITATDSDGASHSTNFELNVNNVAPTITVSEANVTIDEGQTATNSGHFGDPGVDIVTVSASIGDVVFSAGGSRMFVDSGQLVDKRDTTAVAVADLDGDTDLDIFFSNPDYADPTSGHQIYLNDGTGNFIDSGQLLNGRDSFDVSLGDLDGDNDLDAFIVANAGQPAEVWLNDGNANFSNSGQSLGGGNSLGVEIGDLDSDGDLDAFIANSGSGDRVWLNDGNGNFFDSGQSLGGNLGSFDVTLGDVDGDGDLDAFVPSSTSKLWLNNGAGIFVDSGKVFGNQSTGGSRLDDLDADGDLDLFITRFNNGSEVWLNDGTGNFTDTGQVLSAIGTSKVAIGDIDGDGDSDAFVTARNQPNTVWLNNGLGTFVDSGQTLGDSDSFGAAALADVDSDGDLDAVVPNTHAQSNRVWFNTKEPAVWDWTFATSDGPDQSQDVTITATDSDGASNSTHFQLNVNNVPPAFDVGPDETLPVASAGVLSRTGVSFVDPGADVWTGTVNFGDGIGVLPLDVNQIHKCFSLGHTFTAEGTFTVSVTLDDGDGGSHTDSFDVTVNLNNPPRAEAGGPYYVSEGGSVTLDASGSNDPDQDDSTLTYEWDFDGDDEFDDATGIHPTFDASALDGPSSVTVELRVTDDYGETSTDSSVISVFNVAPSVAIVDAPAESAEGSAITLSSSVADPATQDTLTYAWSVTKDGHPYGAITLSDSPTLVFTPNNNALFKVTLVVTDDDGEAGTDTKSIHVTNVPPAVTLSGPLSAEEGQTKSYSFTTSDPGDDTFSWVIQSCGVHGTLTNPAFDSTTGSGSFDCTFLDGPHSSDVSVQVADSDSANSNVATLTVSVANVAPQATFPDVDPVDEGSSFTLALTDPSDPSLADTAAGFEYAFDCGDGAGFGAFGANSTQVCSTTDNGDRTVKAMIRDKDGGVTEYADTVTVRNVAPTIDAITAPLEPVNVNDEAVRVDIAFSDVGSGDSHEVFWDWGDSSEGDTQADATSPASQSHTYAEPGVYTVTVTVTDDDGGTATDVFEYIVLYDPEGGFVTGGGWIYSQPGWCQLDNLCANAEGKANFGFVSKYKKGATVPTGNTEFNFSAGGLDFHSDAYKWLVVNQDDTSAQFKGSGTINGGRAPNGELYQFMVWAIDGNDAGEDDAFRMKIWYEDELGTELIVYDNGFDQAIGGGSIVVHTDK